MKKLLLALLIGIAGIGLVACDITQEKPKEDDDIVEVIPGEDDNKEEETPKEEDKEDEKEDGVVIQTIIFNEVISTDGKAIKTSASKIQYNDIYELDFNGIKGRADGFGITSGIYNKNDFILKSFKEDVAFLELTVEEDTEIELDLQMWGTKDGSQWFGELQLNDILVAKGMESLNQNTKTFQLTLKAGSNTFKYISVGGSFASQLVFKEMRIIK